DGRETQVRAARQDGEHQCGGDQRQFCDPRRRHQNLNAASKPQRRDAEVAEKNHSERENTINQCASYSTHEIPETQRRGVVTSHHEAHRQNKSNARLRNLACCVSTSFSEFLPFSASSASSAPL